MRVSWPAMAVERESRAFRLGAERSDGTKICLQHRKMSRKMYN